MSGAAFAGPAAAWSALGLVDPSGPRSAFCWRLWSWRPLVLGSGPVAGPQGPGLLLVIIGAASDQ
jgi:hypothetical protein